jgi:hypothetical protein
MIEEQPRPAEGSSECFPPARFIFGISYPLHKLR